MKRLGKFIAVICGVIVFLILALQIVVNMPFVGRMVTEALSGSIDGNLRFSKLHISLIRDFPDVKVTVDSLSLTYPHDRFQRYYSRKGNRLRSAGRGESADTLISASRVTVAANPWPLLQGVARLDEANIEDLAIFAHRFCGASNWNVFIPSDKSEEPEIEDTVSALDNLPAFEIRGVGICGRSRLVYTDDPQCLYSSLKLGSISLSGDLKLASSPENISYKDLSLILDTTVARISSAPDFYRIGIDRFSIMNPSRNVLEFGLDGELVARIDSLGRFEIPTALKGCLQLAGAPDNMSLDMKARLPGVELTMDGSVKNLTGDDPLYDVKAGLRTNLNRLSSCMLEKIGIEAGGDLNVDLDARALVSELKTYEFKTSHITGSIFSDCINIAIPSDSLDAVLHRPDIKLQSGQSGLDLSVDSDSLFFRNGEAVRARARQMKNDFHMFKVEHRGELTPKLVFETEFGSFFMKAGDNRLGVRDLRATASSRKRVQRKPDAVRDSLIMRRRLEMMAEVDTTDTDFVNGDISIRLDSTMSTYLREWSPAGKISIGRAFYSTPSMPLRTRITAFSGEYTSNSITLDSLQLKIGTSDISADGKVSGLRRALRKKGTINAKLNLKSDRLNLNELLVAFQDGKKIEDTTQTDSYSEGDFVVDSIENAQSKQEKLPLLIMPGNIDADLNLYAGRVDYSDILINPFTAHIRLKDRTLQLTNADAATNLGRINLDAFYSTKSKKDISAGLGLALSDVSAEGIIQLLPKVDNLLPALKSFHGKLGLELSATSQVDTNMNVIVPTMDGILRIEGKDLYINDAGDLRKITKLLMFRNKDIGHIQDLSVDAVVHDGKLEIFPFVISVDRYKMALRGYQNFEGKMNYHASVMNSPFLIPFGINIYGYPDNWRFSIGFAKYRNGKVPVYSEQLDNMQVNIVRSIKDVFKKGVNNARVQARKGPSVLDGEDRDSGEVELVGDLTYNMAEADADALLEAEINEALENNKIDLGKLLEEVEKSNRDKQIEKKISRLKTKKH